MADPFDFLGGIAQSVLGYMGGQKTADTQMQIANMNAQNQLDYATKRIQWTVKDAQNAGINPLAALGNATQSYTNVVGPDSAGAGITNMGQGLSRALSALSSKEDEADRLNKDLVKAQIRKTDADTALTMADASRRAVAASGKPTPLPKPLFESYVDDRGNVHRLPSKDASSAMQNWASMPAQIPIAISELGNAVSSEYHKLMDPVTRYVSRPFQMPASEVRRIQPSSSDFQYIPF